MELRGKGEEMSSGSVGLGWGNGEALAPKELRGRNQGRGGSAGKSSKHLETRDWIQGPLTVLEKTNKGLESCRTSFRLLMCVLLTTTLLWA